MFTKGIKFAAFNATLAKNELTIFLNSRVKKCNFFETRVECQELPRYVTAILKGSLHTGLKLHKNAQHATLQMRNMFVEMRLFNDMAFMRSNSFIQNRTGEYSAGKRARENEIDR